LSLVEGSRLLVAPGRARCPGARPVSRCAPGVPVRARCLRARPVSPSAGGILAPGPGAISYQRSSAWRRSAPGLERFGTRAGAAREDLRRARRETPGRLLRSGPARRLR
jgi:hypothetical protein